MSIAHPPASVPYAEFAAMQQERDQWRGRYFEEHKARKLAEHERDQERQRQQQRRKFWQTKLKPAEKATLEAVDRQLQSPHAHRDEEGFTRITWKTAAINIGMSDKNTRSCFDKTLAQCPDLLTLAGAQTKTREEYDEELKRNIPRLYLKTEHSLIEAATKSEISQRKVQGGNQYECQRCHSQAVVIHRILECLKCGHKVDLEPTYPNGKLKHAKDAEPSKTNLSLPPQNGYSAENCQDADDSQDENFLTTSGQVVDVGYKPVTPPELDSLPDAQAEQEAAAELEEETRVIEEAAALLLEIAGEDENHIEMSRTGIKKYYDAKPPRPLTLADLIDHLQGGQARGSRCSYRDGRTRGQCFDKDEAQSWEELQEAARKLAAAGYSPILEESPAERGGHMWLVYSGLVDGPAARAAALQIAPELENCIEYWPGPASAEKWNRVRLPGGYYARYGKHVERPVKAWCRLFNVATGETASDGRSAARLLLSSLTDASIVPPLPPISSEPAPEIDSQDEQAEQLPTGSTSAQDRQSNCPPAAPLSRTGSVSANSEELEARSVAQQPAPFSAGRAAPLPNSQDDDQAADLASAGAGPLKLPQVDAEWERRYGKIEETTFWFAIMPEVAAAWYNKNHPLESIRPTENNGMALSPNGNERTASTGYYEKDQGERWTDFSTHGRRADGTHESGDALELASKVQGKSKGTLINEARAEIMTEARAALESAAAAGQGIPAWLEEPCIITPAGRRHHVELLAAAAQGQTVTPEAVTIDEPQSEPEPEAAALVTELPLAAVTQQESDQAERERRAQEAAEFEEWKRTRPEEYQAWLDDLNASIRAQVAEREAQDREREQQAPLKSGQRVSTPEGVGTVSSVVYLEGMKQWRCSVWLDKSRSLQLFASEVQPIEQGRIF